MTTVTVDETLTTSDRLVALGLLIAVLVAFALAVWILYRLALWFVVTWYGQRWGVQQDSVFSKPYPMPDQQESAEGRA